MSIYFDNASTTFLNKKVYFYIKKLLKNKIYNPSSLYSKGLKYKYLIEKTKILISKYLNVSSNEIFFTSSGTESNNFVIYISIFFLNIKYIITTKMEHNSLLKIINYFKNKKIKCFYLKNDKKGDINYYELNNYINKYNKKKILVSLMHVNNEIGNIYNINLIIKICKKYNNVFLHSDIVQSIGYLNVNIKKLDFATISLHKIHGPLGLGIIYKNKNIFLKNGFIMGGNQENYLRAGTENIYAILSSKIIFKDLFFNKNKYNKNIFLLKKYLLKQLLIHIKGIKFNGYSNNFNKSINTILNIRLPIKNNLLLFLMDKYYKIFISYGSSCNKIDNINIYSHVLKNILNYNNLHNFTSIRLSFSYLNTLKEIDNFIISLKDILYNKKKYDY
ncbi:MAG: aminotransferase class V-fold PLP-dependent enzyme [Candidatus Shikimatogenerans sp. Tcar]|uniref:Aminotransferase class V-fold PLP-dependent enzyme n=1 Tax=Candidatus Shikimatogenerans sp. Tcar TaxID=3158565 RepID=A0AAU7QUY6_9FLAO